MKKLPIYLLTIFLWTSCGNKKSASEKAYNTERHISSNQEFKKEITNSKAENLSIREYGQKIIDGEIQPSDNTETFACLDSMDDENADTRKFFFQVYRVIAKKSDGALSEVVGSYTKSYLQTFPTEAINHFKNLDTSERKLFVNDLAFEFYASSDDYKVEINEYFANIYNSNPKLEVEKELVEEIKRNLIILVSKMNE